MIRISQLSVQRNGHTICTVPDLTVEAGERVVIVGDNGAGKTTLLRVVVGLERDYDGVCRVDAVWRDIAFVHQHPFLFRGTVLSNVTYGLCARRVSRNTARKQALYWLDRLGVARLADANSQALAVDPALLVLDEPLADMDDQGAEAARTVLAELSRATIMIASPTQPPEGLATRVYRLANAAFEKEHSK
jgi:ABC-type nitrate/sulfonate/bicarbonate transport system ATPase subunit